MKSKKQKLKIKLWRLVSEYVRSSAADWRGRAKCFTCGTPHPWKELNAGHYIHDKLDFDLRNLKPQCVACNMWKSGKLDVYAEKLVKIYGLEWVEKLRKDAVKKGNDYSIEEMERLYEDFKTKLDNL